MKPIAVALFLCLTAFPAKADKCDPLVPTTAQNVDDDFKGRMEGELKGIISRLAGGAASIDGEYRRIATDELNNYPDSDKLYVWQRIIYLACVSPDLKIDMNELLRLYFTRPSSSSSAGQSPTTVAGACPPGTVPTPHPAVGIENDHSAIGEEYTDSPSGIYNYCSVVDKEKATATPNSQNLDPRAVYRIPKTDPAGNPCKAYIFKQIIDHNMIIGRPAFNPLGSPPGTCIAEQSFTNNLGGGLTNHRVTITKQSSSGNIRE